MGIFEGNAWIHIDIVFPKNERISYALFIPIALEDYLGIVLYRRKNKDDISLFPTMKILS